MQATPAPSLEKLTSSGNASAPLPTAAPTWMGTDGAVWTLQGSSWVELTRVREYSGCVRRLCRRRGLSGRRAACAWLSL
jgi:hypothetical protein